MSSGTLPFICTLFLSLTFTLPIAISAVNISQKALEKLQKLRLQLYLRHPSLKSSYELLGLLLSSEVLNAEKFLREITKAKKSD